MFCRGNTHKYKIPTPMLNTVPNVRAILAARVVVRFQNTPKRNTAAIGGAINPSTDWKTLNRFSPLMLSIAMVIITEISAPTTVTTCPTLIISLCLACGRIFFT